jgi:RNA polymerase sigma-70 factor (ECF subfamily)
MDSATQNMDRTYEKDGFTAIVRRFGPLLRRYIHARIDNASADDVLQDTFIAVWSGMNAVRDPQRLQAWVMHVAQNRCRDYFRSRQRREISLHEEALQDYAGRFGLHQYRHEARIADVMDALDAGPSFAREAALLFYRDGLSIAEIAAETQSPPGTVKRRLFTARMAARAFLGVPATNSTGMETTIMTTRTVMENPTAFPTTRPPIRITELTDTPFRVDCRELRCWPIIPIVGQQAAAGDYFYPDWGLSEVAEMRAIRPATLHKVEGVEIEVRSWKPGAGETSGGWQRPGTIYARLTDDAVEYLGVHLPHAEFTQFETFLDASFAWNWGAVKRAIDDDGSLMRQANGSLMLDVEAVPGQGAGIGCGVVKVEIGSKSFVCLRVVEAPETGIEGGDHCVTEAYITQEGRTVLVRRYCRPDFVDVAQFSVQLDESDALIFNGIAYFHWHDTIMDMAVRVDS